MYPYHQADSANTVARFDFFKYRLPPVFCLPHVSFRAFFCFPCSRQNRFQSDQVAPQGARRSKMAEKYLNPPSDVFFRSSEVKRAVTESSSTAAAKSSLVPQSSPPSVLPGPRDTDRSVCFTALRVPILPSGGDDRRLPTGSCYRANSIHGAPYCYSYERS